MKLLNWFSVSVLFSVGTLGAWGQSTATLSGTVTDPSGAVVPGAHVKVHSLATGLDRVIDTNSDGLYVVPSLQPGDYSVQATASGFSSYSVQKVTVDVAQTVAVNMHLAVASAGETVQVESTAQQIETQTMTVGQVIDRKTVQDIPLNGRHFLDLTVLTPGGVVAPTSGSLTSPSRGLGANSFITAGNREDSVNFQINGVNLNDISQNQITFQPSISTTSEFKINNSTFSAEYGRSDGSIVTVATRSGTNQFHGEAFDYFRNEALDARNYFNRNFSPTTGLPLAGLPGEKAPLKRNNFGGSVGGPIWKGKTFFYASYEGLRQHQGILQNSTVLTPAQQATIAANAATFPVAAALAKLIPLPNSGNNYVAFTPGPVNIDQYTGDVLHQFSSNDSLHGFYAFQKDVRTEPALQGDTVPGWGDHRAAHRQILTLSETHIFNPNFVNEARLGFNRISIAFNPANLTDPTSVGLGDGLSGNVGLPQTTLSDIGLVFGGPSGFPQGRNDTLGILSDTATLLRGKHTIKFGGEFRRYLSASFAANIGTLTFVSTPNNFEMDNATVFSIQPNTVSSRVYADAAGAFVQDNFKITQRLTLEYGLRFEWNGTPVEGANRFVLFNPAGVGGPTLTQVGTNGLAANSAYGQNYNYEPRVGFAEDLFGTGKTVIRGGYAYLVDQPVSDAVTGLASNPPFSTAVSYNGAAIPLSSLYASAKAAGIGISSINPNFKNAYIESFNLNVQQALPDGIVASLGYYGSVGRHLRITTNENQASGPVGSPHLYSNLSANSPIDPGVSIASNISEVNSIGTSNYNAMWAVLSKNMSHGLEINMNYEWSKSMDINSLGSEGGLTAAGGALQDSNNPSGNYGLSDFDTRNHVAGTAIYALPFKGNRLVSGYQLSTIVQYQTGNPVNITAGSSSYNGLTGVVRPSQVGHIITHKSQTPVAGSTSSFTNVTFIQNTGGLSPGGTVCDVTTYTPACVFEIQGTQASSATATAPSNYTGIGNMQRNAVTGPGFADVDLSGQKETKLFAGVAFILRVDAFDILNHPNFGQPSGNVQSSTFGQISSTRFATSDGGSSRQLQISGKFTF
ncbi:carboxypeptidase-like regulatory domain-containing protein [Granulicella sp. S156]|uniref:TonB-dependent receptor n=1 Tax=Granulicella sp. S156 TaxID=1747224 RepID=UPI00131EA353|nr:carboxypeptidase-like regulatory domain-containing protein [Granulicella sp. S156]